MNIFNPWNAVYFVGFVVYFYIRKVFAQRTRQAEKSHRQFDRLEIALLILMVPGTLLLPLLYLFTPLLRFADYRLPLAALWCGVFIMCIALWLFWRSHADLGQNWSVSLELRKNHELVTQGVYRSIRHPMYASIWLFSLAQGLLLQNWLAGWSALLGFAVLYFIRMPREERMMCEFFGEEYREYMTRTGRLVPCWWKLRREHDRR